MLVLDFFFQQNHTCLAPKSVVKRRISLVLGGLWREAVGMLRDMERNGVSPDVITYNAAIMALSRNRRWKEALGPRRALEQYFLLFCDMTKLAKNVKNATWIKGTPQRSMTSSSAECTVQQFYAFLFSFGQMMFFFRVLVGNSHGNKSAIPGSIPTGTTQVMVDPFFVQVFRVIR